MLEKINGVLTEIVNIKGVRGALLVSSEGFEIARSITKELDTVALSALCASIYSGTIETLEILDQKHTKADLITIETPDVKLLIRQIGNFLLVVATNDQVILGYLRMKLQIIDRKIMPLLAEISP